MKISFQVVIQYDSKILKSVLVVSYKYHINRDTNRIVNKYIIQIFTSECQGEKLILSRICN